MPFFSIITVCFNAEKYIVETMKSVYEQTFQDIEYIIVDGLSNDGTISKINRIKKEYDSTNITKVISEADKGIYDAMNKGIRISQGRYCYFLNAGDSLVAADVLYQIAEQIGNHPYGYVYGDIFSVSATFKKYVKAQNMQIISTSLAMPYCHQAVFVSKDYINNHKFDLKYKNAADYNQCIQLYMSDLEYLYVNIPIANYQIGGRSETGALSYLKEKIIIRENNCLKKPSKLQNDYMILKTQIQVFIKRILPLSLIETIRRIKAKY